MQTFSHASKPKEMRVKVKVLVDTEDQHQCVSARGARRGRRWSQELVEEEEKEWKERQGREGGQDEEGERERKSQWVNEQGKVTSARNINWREWTLINSYGLPVPVNCLW